MPVFVKRSSEDATPFMPSKPRSFALSGKRSIRRVLIADSCPDTVESTSMILRLWGHDVRGVGTGREVLELAHIYRPEVVLMEMALPGLDGCEVARRLRQQNADSRPILVAVTGYGDVKNRRRCRAAGFDFHLLKPVEPDVLHRVLATSHRPARGR